MASGADSDVTWGSQWIRTFDYAIASRPVVDNTYCRAQLDQTVLYGLRSRSKLADRDVQLPIDHVVRWPWMWPFRPVVEQIPGSGRVAEHWQYAGVRKSLAQAVLRVAKVRRRAGDLPGQLLCAIVDQKLLPRLKSRSAVRKQDIGDTLHLDGVLLEPVSDKLPSGSARGTIGGRYQRSFIPPGGGSEFAVNALAPAIREQVQSPERLAQDLFRQNALDDALPLHIHVRLRGRA